MQNLFRKGTTAATFMASIAFSTYSFAQAGTLAYGPLPSNVPTLGGSALIVLAILLAVIAFRIMRTQEHKGVNMVITLVAVTALVSGVSGVNLVADALAIQAGMADPAGGEAPLFEGQNTVPNSSGVTQKVLNVETIPSCFIGKNGGDGGGDRAIAPNGGGNGGGELKCAQKPTVPAGESCTVSIVCLS